MHLKSNYPNSDFLALVGSHSIATGTGGAVGEGVSAATASHHGRRPKLGSAKPLGAECAPTTPEPNWDDNVLPLPRKKNTIKADIGILTPESKPCPGLHDLCEVDETSLLGGRCTVSSRRMEISEQEKLQECTAKCPGNKLCDCKYGQASDDECTSYSFIASACRNKDFSRCLTKSRDNWTAVEVLWCPFYSCLDDIDEENNNNVDAYGVCLTCVHYKNVCDYCKKNDGSFFGCAEDDVYNVCKNAPIDKTHHYSQNCTDSLESLGEILSWDDIDDSKGGDNGDKDDGSGVGKSSDNGGTTDPIADGNGEGTGDNKSDASSFVETQKMILHLAERLC
eukprot:121490_1